MDVAYTYTSQAYVSVVSGVSYVCLKVFHLHVAYVCNDFQMFFRRFCKCFRRLFQVFHLSFLYVSTVASGCFKIRSGVAHRMYVVSG
jgi:hypothetical protein